MPSLQQPQNWKKTKMNKIKRMKSRKHFETHPHDCPKFLNTMQTIPVDLATSTSSSSLISSVFSCWCKVARDWCEPFSPVQRDHDSRTACYLLFGKKHKTRFLIYLSESMLWLHSLYLADPCCACRGPVGSLLIKIYDKTIHCSAQHTEAKVTFVFEFDFLAMSDILAPSPRLRSRCCCDLNFELAVL